MFEDVPSYEATMRRIELFGWQALRLVVAPVIVFGVAKGVLDIMHQEYMDVLGDALGVGVGVEGYKTASERIHSLNDGGQGETTPN